ncbi:energy-coupling factor ABC transporter permease [Noviherbaspirillum sp.]|uniref:energy-coupling factor ABC transporter permease n=1 Tax=Noviherbaspirillum sp. TaxID=1926288 RepID=UPI002D475718|nr:energy-coupling factor ABC transporter permease [Noviherbaspirillum sp.]HZW22441.1 energy-coupling factor ABC transporter permease [Noviherbaspirillum sp.]
MGIFDAALPTSVAAMTAAAAFAAVYRSARWADWRRLSAPGAFSAWCCAIILLPLVWRFSVPLPGGPALHMVGLPIFVLMFGRRLAMTGAALSVFAYTLAFDGLWLNFGLNLLLLAVLPAYCGDALMRATERFLPRHMFVYLLGNGFFGAMAMLAILNTLSLGVYYTMTFSRPLGPDIVAYALLLSWGESFLTGLLLTMFTVYRPEWVLTFDDKVYLSGK